jgi:hypothetical protein
MIAFLAAIIDAFTIVVNAIVARKDGRERSDAGPRGDNTEGDLARPT